jgi:predicted transposase YbfD/YdcC
VKLKPKTTIEEHFSAIKDPRLDRTKLHQLIDIITITLCAVISGAESWSDIELFGQCKYDWFKSFLELPNGIPSHDTFNRVFARLDTEQLEKCFSDWVKSINSLLPGEQIAIDGKTLRHSYDHNKEQKAIVMVSAWARDSGLVLAQRKVSKKSNEITAVPELLKVLDVEFNEDNSRIRKDNAPENLAVIRHIALNLLRQNKKFKGSIKSKRNRAGWDNNYLREILIN